MSTDDPPWVLNREEVSDGQGSPGDEQNYLKFEYEDGVGQWGGAYLKFKNPRDLSNYTHLSFWTKTSKENSRFRVWFEDSDQYFYPWQKQTVTATTEWKRIVITLEKLSFKEKTPQL